jgi:hypothetical protein
MSAAVLRIVKSPSGAKTHRMNEAHAVLGLALCGAKVARPAVEKAHPEGGDCRRCRELAGEGGAS